MEGQEAGQEAGHERRDCCSIEQALEVLRDHEVNSNSRFSVYTSTKGFGATNLTFYKFPDIVEIYSQILCKVTDSSAPLDRKQMAQDLLYRLHNGEDVPHERNIIVCVPHTSQHTGHPVGPEEVLPQPIDPRLSQKIKELAMDNILEPSVMRSQLNAFVRTICNPLPHPTNKRFYPTDKTIRNHLYLAKNQRLINDQAKIEAWVNEMKKSQEDFIFCRLKCDREKEQDSFVLYGSKFLFVYQSAEQKRLLRRYGSTVLVDATYKTTLYDLPLFFLAVKTNVNYQVVGCFITEDETTDSIAEALSFMRDNCFENQPPYFLTDFDECEITALERVFPGSRVLIWDFHRQQAWERWTSKSSNSFGQKDDILKLLRKVALAKNEEAFQSAVDTMRSSVIWQKNTNLQNYFNNVWYPHHKVFAAYSVLIKSVHEDADHRRHHEFCAAPFDVVRKQKKKFAFGQYYYSQTAMEVLTEKLMADILYKVPDKKNPVTSLPSSMIRFVPKDSVLWNVFIEHKLLASQYIIYVLRKELLILIASLKYSRPYEKCEMHCHTTEMDSKLMFGV